MFWNFEGNSFTKFWYLISSYSILPGYQAGANLCKASKHYEQDCNLKGQAIQVAFFNSQKPLFNRITTIKKITDVTRKLWRFTSVKHIGETTLFRCLPRTSESSEIRWGFKKWSEMTTSQTYICQFWEIHNSSSLSTVELLLFLLFSL